MKREDMVAELAPHAPPCYSGRQELWVSYCQSASLEQRDGHEPGPLMFTALGVTVPNTVDSTAQLPRKQWPILIEKGREVRFNPAFSFCGECTAPWQARMDAKDQCRPTYLRDLLEG